MKTMMLRHVQRAFEKIDLPPETEIEAELFHDDDLKCLCIIVGNNKLPLKCTATVKRYPPPFEGGELVKVSITPPDGPIAGTLGRVCDNYLNFDGESYKFYYKIDVDGIQYKICADYLELTEEENENND